MMAVRRSFCQKPWSNNQRILYTTNANFRGAVL